MTLEELKKILYVIDELYIAFTSNDYILTHDEYCKFSEKIETAFEILENKIKEQEVEFNVFEERGSGIEYIIFTGTYDECKKETEDIIYMMKHDEEELKRRSNGNGEPFSFRIERTKSDNLKKYDMKTKKKFKNRTNKGKLLYIRDISITAILYLALIYMLVFLAIAVINFLK